MRISDWSSDVCSSDLPPPKPSLIQWLLFGSGPGPGEAPYAWRKQAAEAEGAERPKVAIKFVMCAGIYGGPACVRACPTGAEIRVAPEKFLSVARPEGAGWLPAFPKQMHTEERL